MKKSKRLYSVEGAIHLYSSMPIVMTPADIYSINENLLNSHALSQCNIYLIVQRNRIFINPEGFSLNHRTVHGQFLTHTANRIRKVPFEFIIPSDIVPLDIAIKEVAVALNGTTLLIKTENKDHIINVNKLISYSKSDLYYTETDLRVVYIGQGIGRIYPRTSVNRLRSHTSLQRILSDIVTFTPEMDVFILLYRFEHSRTILSNGGNLNLEPESSWEMESIHFNNLQNVKLTRNQIVSLAEAALINYFQPQYNILLKSRNFASKNKIKVISDLFNSGMVGLIVEICSSSIKSRIGTTHAPPKDPTTDWPEDIVSGVTLTGSAMLNSWIEDLYMLRHTHIAEFELTTEVERNTFLHGTVFLDDAHSKDNINV